MTHRYVTITSPEGASAPVPWRGTAQEIARVAALEAAGWQVSAPITGVEPHPQDVAEALARVALVVRVREVLRG